MCRPVPCAICGKTTWAGCGDHVAQVKETVPADQWCDGHDGASRATVKTGPGLFRIVGR